MIKIGKKKLIIVTFLSVILLCGAVSATNINFSQDGKILTIKPDLVTSTLKTIAIPSNNGIFGKGKYLSIKVTGKDNQGRTNYNTFSIYNNDVKSYSLLHVKGNYFVKASIVYGMDKALMKAYAKIGNNITYTGRGISNVNRVNGLQILNNGLETITVNQNGKLYAIYKVTIKYAHKFFNGKYLNDKVSVTTKTTYLNGDTRTAIVNTVYVRNPNGYLIGKKYSGTSYGTEKINNKTAKYTGKIYIGTRFDPNDWVNEHYNQGDYKEIRTSSSQTLVKRVPLEAM